MWTIFKELSGYTFRYPGSRDGLFVPLQDVKGDVVEYAMTALTMKYSDRFEIYLYSNEAQKHIICDSSEMRRQKAKGSK